MKISRKFLAYFLLFCLNQILIKGEDVSVSPKKNVTRPLQLTKLYNSLECHENIVKYCPRGRIGELTDFAVIQCIYNEIKDLSVLDDDCQHVRFYFD